MKYLPDDYTPYIYRWPAVATKIWMLTVAIVVNVYPCWQVPKAFEILLGKRLGIGKKMFSTSESGEERTLKPWVNDGLGINTVFCIQCTVFNSDFFFFHIPANSSKRIVLNVKGRVNPKIDWRMKFFFWLKQMFTNLCLANTGWFTCI